MSKSTLTPQERAALTRQWYVRMRERMLRVRRLLQARGVRPTPAGQPATAQPGQEGS